MQDGFTDFFFQPQKIAGGNQNIQDIFTTALGTNETSYTLEEVKVAIGTLNTKRKERLLLLLEYIEDQGEPMNNRVKYGTRVIGAHKVLELTPLSTKDYWDQSQ